MGKMGGLRRVFRLQPQHVVHRVAAGLLLGEETGCSDGPVGVTVTGLPADGQVDGLTDHAEDDRVFPDVVAGPQGVVADLVGRSLSDSCLLYTSPSPRD